VTVREIQRQFGPTSTNAADAPLTFYASATCTNRAAVRRALRGSGAHRFSYMRTAALTLTTREHRRIAANRAAFTTAARRALAAV
jgi:hypothetical protein